MFNLKNIYFFITKKINCQLNLFHHINNFFLIVEETGF